MPRIPFMSAREREMVYFNRLRFGRYEPPRNVGAAFPTTSPRRSDWLRFAPEPTAFTGRESAFVFRPGGVGRGKSAPVAGTRLLPVGSLIGG